MSEEWLQNTFPAIEPRPYQMTAWNTLSEGRHNGRERALIHLATGLGKTFVAAVDALRHRAVATKPTRILFVSHMNDISEQAAQTFQDLDPTLRINNYKTAHKNSYKQADAVFATFQSLHLNLDTIPRDHFSYIIWDEVHHIEADTFKKVRDHFTPEFELGLTATPYRNDHKDITEYFGSPIVSKKLASGIADGWLADVDYQIVFDDAVKKAMENGFKPDNLTELKQLFKVTLRNDIIAENIKNERKRIGLDDSKTIVFCSDVKQADEVAKRLGGKSYHSNHSKTARSKMLYDFQKGSIHTLCTRDMFNEGVDIPDARLIVFLRSTSSSTIFEQQLGRGLRKTPDKDKVTVLDFVANLERIVQVRKLGHDIEYAMRNELGHFLPADYSSMEDKSGIKIDISEHATFEFEQFAVDLLETYDQLDAPYAPSGYKTIPNAAKDCGISKENLESMMTRHNWQPRLYKIHTGRVFRMLSPQQIRNVREKLMDNIPFADDTIVSLGKLSRDLQCTPRAIESALDQKGVSYRMYRFPGRRPGLGAKRSDAQIIAEYINPTQYIKLADVRKKLNMAQSTLRRRIQKLGIETDIRKREIHITHDDFQRIKDFSPPVNPRTPTDDLLQQYRKTNSIQRTADKFGVSWTAVKKRLKKLGELSSE